MKKGSKIPQLSKNKMKGRKAWNKGIIISEKIRKKISENTKKAMIGIKWTKEQRYKMGSPRRGKKDTLEAREKNRQGQYRRFEREIPGYNYLDDGRRIRRKIRLKQNGGFHSIGEWETLKAQYNWTCPNCSKKEPDIKLTKDHIISVFNGGSDNIENIQPLCKSCNSKKSTKSW